MSNVTNAPKNVEDGIFINLQQKLKAVGGKLNQDSPQNLHVLLKWAYEEYQKKSFGEKATPEQVADALFVRVKATPKSLIFDVEPDFTPAAPEFTIDDVNKRAEDFAKKEAKRILRENLDNDPKKFEERRKQIEAEKKAAEEVKSEAMAAEQLNNAISRVEFYRGPGRVDHSRSDDIRKALRTVVAKINGVKNNQETLKVVKQIIDRMPDDASVASVQKAIDEITRERAAAAAKPVRRDSLGYL